MREASRMLHDLLPDSEKLGAEHPMARLTFLNRSIIAARAALGGDARAALRLFAEMLPEQERVLGRDHEDTLGTRSAIARATYDLGDAREALRLFAELLPDQERVLGPDHENTLETRGKVATCTRDLGDTREACGYSPSCSRIRTACWATTTQTPWSAAATSLIAPAKWARCGRRCGYPSNC